jgi:hypothetical protein
MGESKIERERIIESDFPILEEKTKELRSILLEAISVVPLQVESWPYRYQYSYDSYHFECIFSAMGSFTLRLATDERYRRNPPPIFYISIGKYKGEYIWENGDGEPVSILPNDLKDFLHQSIQKYISSLQKA